MTRLSPRLAAVASLIPPGSRTADIGCDHAYLCIRLVSDGVSPRCIASDVRPGPLARAAANVAAAGLSDRIDLRIGDGLSTVGPAECDAVVLAGMGGDTMEHILRDAPWTADGAHCLVLQPQSHEDTLRLWLSLQGFSIQDERVARDRGTVYRAFRCAPGEGDRSPLAPYVSPAYLHLGRAERAEYDARLLRRLSVRIGGLRAAGKDAEAERLEAVFQTLSEVLK